MGQCRFTRTDLIDKALWLAPQGGKCYGELYLSIRQKLAESAAFFGRKQKRGTSGFQTRRAAGV